MGQEKCNCAKTGLTSASQRHQQQMPAAHVPGSTVGTEEAETPRPSVRTAFVQTSGVVCCRGDSSSQPTLTCWPLAVTVEFRTEGMSDVTVVVFLFSFYSVPEELFP